MANEQLAIDGNTRNTLGAVTNDAAEEIRRVRINPVTGAMIVEASITSTNTSIGSTIPGGTAGSVLFLGLGSTLDQNNVNFFWDNNNDFLGLGTNTPAATLDIEGTFKYVDGSQTNGYVLTTDGSGNATWAPAPSSSGGITSINGDTTAAQTLTDASSGYITITDDMTGEHTFAIDIPGLANDSTFISDLTSNTAFVADIVNIVNTDPTISIDLTSQVTGILPVANGGTNSGTSLSGSSIMISDGTSVVQGAKGTTTTVLHGNAAGAPTYSAVVLTTDVSGILPVSNGGTGDSSLTAYAPLFGGTTSTAPIQSGTVGTTGQVLTSNGTGAIATFQTPTATVSVKSGVQNITASASPTVIAHGLGTTPSFGKFTALTGQGTATYPMQSAGTYDGTNNQVAYIILNGSANPTSGSNTSHAIYLQIQTGSTPSSLGVVTWDATNITITWDVQTQYLSLSLLWEVYG